MAEAGEYQLVGYPIESPLVNTAGSINGTNEERIRSEVQTLSETGIGAITYGSLTVPGGEGNEAKYGPPVYYHNTVTGETFNSLGLPNIGKDAAVMLIPELAVRTQEHGKPFIVSGSPTVAPNYGGSVDQARQLAYDFLQTNADLVELNVSCPNVVTEGGGRKPIMGYDLETMHELLEVLSSEVGSGQRLGVKLPPYISEEELTLVPELAKLFKAQQVFRFLVTSNTIPNQIALDDQGKPILSVPEGKGGMSGPATKTVGREQLALWHSELGDRLDIISTLGVDSGEELAVRRRMGAVAAGGVTFLWESRDWGTAVSQMLSDYAAAE